MQAAETRQDIKNTVEAPQSNTLPKALIQHVARSSVLFNLAKTMDQSSNTMRPMPQLASSINLPCTDLELSRRSLKDCLLIVDIGWYWHSTHFVAQSALRTLCPPLQLKRVGPARSSPRVRLHPWRVLTEPAKRIQKARQFRQKVIPDDSGFAGFRWFCSLVKEWHSMPGLLEWHSSHSLEESGNIVQNV